MAIEKEGLISLFIEKGAALFLRAPDRVKINGLDFNVNGIKFWQAGDSPKIELIHKDYQGEVKDSQLFNLNDINEMVFYKWHDPEYSDKRWEELFRYPVKYGLEGGGTPVGAI